MVKEYEKEQAWVWVFDCPIPVYLCAECFLEKCTLYGLQLAGWEQMNDYEEYEYCVQCDMQLIKPGRRFD